MEQILQKFSEQETCALSLPWVACRETKERVEEGAGRMQRGPTTICDAANAAPSLASVCVAASSDE